ncbi:MAG: AMP-binding protein [Clostridia bacterium]|nr:AMP-binding protein [Clostridia bacterium]
MNLLSKFLNKTDFTDYNDYYANYKLNVPENFNFAYDVIEEYAKCAPQKRAILWCNDEGEERSFTYAELNAEVNKTANFFKRAGVKKGDFVLLILRRHYQFWTSIYALHKIGAVAIPATHLLTKKDIVYRCNSADVKMIICSDKGDIKDHVKQALPECTTVEICCVLGEEKIDNWYNLDIEIQGESLEFPRPQGCDATTNSDPMLVYFTSGTTGNPKMVMHNFTYPLGHISTGKYWHNVYDDGLHLTVADSGWAKCSWGKLYGQLIAGTAQFIYDYSDKFVPTDLLELIGKYKITTFCAPPTIYRFFIKSDMKKYDLSSLKHISTAGEALNPEVFNQILAGTGLKVYEGFGQTESPILLGNFYFEEPKPGSMGRPTAGFKAVLIRDDFTVCDAGEIGQVAFDITEGKPVGVLDCYYKDKEKTDSVFVNGYYLTGDLAWCDEDGYYWYVGRADDVIKSSGYRIGPFEVESALMEHPAVFETAITAVPDEIRGQIVKATIVLAKGFRPSDELKKELQDHVKRTTAPYKYPRIVEFVDELPKTISGKIKRAEIRNTDKTKKQ